MRSYRESVYELSVGLLLGLAVLVLLFRTGHVPGASCGDEVWWSESGYYLLENGQLKWPMLDSSSGLATVSFWPPVLPILQAVFFRIFGVNDIGMCAQSTLHCILTSWFVACIVKVFNKSSFRAMCAALSVYGPMSIERQLTQVRMENMTTALGLGAFLLLLLAKRIDCSLKLSSLFAFSSGLFASVGLISYYPLSPSLLFAFVVCVPMLRLRTRLWAAFVLGGVPVSACFLAWVTSDWALFCEQVLRSGNDSLSPIRAVLSLFPLSFSLSSLTQWERIIATAVAAFFARRRFDDDLHVLAVFSICNATSLALFVGLPQMIPTCVLLVILFSRGQRGSPQTQCYPRFLSAILFCTTLCGVLKLLLMATTLVYQVEGRDYTAVRKELQSLDLSNGGVAISQRAWLATRPIVDERRLHFLVYSGYSMNQASRITKEKDAAEFFEWLVLETPRIEELSRIYPWIGQGIKVGRYKFVKRIVPHFRPLPWAASPSYDLTVMRRVDSRNSIPVSSVD